MKNYLARRAWLAGRIKLVFWIITARSEIPSIYIVCGCFASHSQWRALQFSQYETMDGDEGLLDGQAHDEGGSRDDSRDRDEERKARNRAALKKFRDKEKKEKEEKARRMEQLRRENEEIEQRTAVHQQVRWQV